MSGRDPWPAPRRLLALAGGLLTVAAALTVSSLVPDSQATARTDETLALLGGLGGGRATDMRRCRAAFDPRLAHTCDLHVGATPGGGVLCADHRTRREVPTDGD